MTQAQAQTPVQAQANILIVDDELLNRKLFQTLLHLKGYLTSTAANADEALSLMRQNTPDLILLDIMMPGTDGYQLAEIIKTDAAWTNIPIIMVTALIDPSSRTTGIVAGADDVLTKPVDRSELWLKIKNLLRLQELEVLRQVQKDLLKRNLELEQHILQSTTKLQNLANILHLFESGELN